MSTCDELFVLSFDILSLSRNKVLCWIPTMSLSVWKTIKTHHLTNLTIKKHQFTMKNYNFRRVFSPFSSPSRPRQGRLVPLPRHRRPGGWLGGRAASGAEKRRPGHSAAHLTRWVNMWRAVGFCHVFQQKSTRSSWELNIRWNFGAKWSRIWTYDLYDL